MARVFDICCVKKEFNMKKQLKIEGIILPPPGKKTAKLCFVLNYVIVN